MFLRRNPHAQSQLASYGRAVGTVDCTEKRSSVEEYYMVHLSRLGGNLCIVEGVGLTEVVAGLGEFFLEDEAFELDLPDILLERRGRAYNSMTELLGDSE